MGSKLHARHILHGPPLPQHEDIRAYTKEYAEELDERDPLREFRDQFIIPSKKDLARKQLANPEG
jgi:kynureninase